MITLYVPCYNAGAFLGACLEGVARQSLSPDRVLVIDDGSTDGSVGVAAASVASELEVEIVRHDRNRGLVAARNTALELATGELVAALDADCVPEPDWLARLARHFERDRFERDRRLAGAGGHLRERHQSAVGDRWRTVHMPQHWGDQTLEPRFLFGCNTVHRLAAVRALGGFDRRLRSNFEDVDLSERLLAAGHRLIYEPAARVEHLRRDDHLSVLRTYWNWLSPAFRIDGLFDDQEGLLEMLGHHLDRTVSFIAEDLEPAAELLDVDLPYVDMLLFPFHALLDVKQRIEVLIGADPRSPEIRELRCLAARVPGWVERELAGSGSARTLPLAAEARADLEHLTREISAPGEVPNERADPVAGTIASYAEALRGGIVTVVGALRGAV